jgi:hypothetical protein
MLCSATGTLPGPTNSGSPRWSNARNDSAFDAVWFARGGYGAGADRAGCDRLRLAACGGAQDLAGLFGRRHTAGRAIPRADRPAGPCADAGRRARAAAVMRPCAARLLAGRATARARNRRWTAPRAAFNLMTLAMLCGNPADAGAGGSCRDAGGSGRASLCGRPAVLPPQRASGRNCWAAAGTGQRRTRKRPSSSARMARRSPAAGARATRFPSSGKLTSAMTLPTGLCPSDLPEGTSRF